MSGKLKILTLNLGNYGSTGRIIDSLAKLAAERGHTTRRAYPLSYRTLAPREGDVIVCSRTVNRINQRLARLTGLIGFFSYFHTLRFISRAKKYSPDLLHIHNVHSSFICLPLLSRYIKRSGVRTIWTLHDCWAFTGKCAHFTAAGCDGWRHGCGDCPELASYPRTDRDLSAYLLKKKKKWLSDLPDLTLVTPSKWLASLVSESFLGCYPVRVIQNGIDTELFCPRESDVRERLEVGERHLLISVSLDWSERKGLDTILELARRLGDGYRILLVGFDGDTQALPENVCAIARTSSQVELAELYSAADLFVNPTREDTFPTVNLESLACGTPVLTFDVGGASEMLSPSCGVSVAVGDTDALEREARRICEDAPFASDDCVARASEFVARERFEEYIKLYEDQTKES